MLKAAQSSGQPSALVQAAANGHAAQLRNMPREQAAGLIMLELPLVAQAYGGRHEIDSAVYAECVRLILAKFPGIGVNEIREAYRMKAAGELNMQNGKGEMWGGEFNAQQLGDVLAAYMEVRRRALSAFLRLQHEQAQAAEKAAIAERQKAAYLEAFPARVEQVRNAQDWREVPEWIYDECRRRGLIRFEAGEAGDIYEDAKELARLEAVEAYEGAMQRGENILKLKDLQHAAINPESTEARAKVIARKLSLFRKLKI